MTRKPIRNLSLTLLTASALLAASALMTACDQKDLVMPDGPLPPSDKVPLQLTSGISTTRSVTRAHDTSWDAGDQIGVFTTVAGSGSGDANPFVYTKSGSSYDANIAYKITTDEQTLDGSTHVYKSFLPSTEGKLIYLPADGSDVDVYAYYPYSAAVWPENATAPSPLDITIPASQTLENQKTTDVLKAKALSSTSTIDIDHTTAHLLFEHVLSKVIIIVKYDTGYSYDDISGRVAVQITGQPVSATFAPITQALTITDSSTPITPCEITGNTDPDNAVLSGEKVVCAYRALLLPNLPNGTSQNPATDTDRKIIFTVGDKTEGAVTTTYIFDLSNNNTPAVGETPAGNPNIFEAGKVTVFTLKLAATGITIEAAIQPWTIETVSPEPIYEDS